MGLRKIEERLLPKGNSIVASSLNFAMGDSIWKTFGFQKENECVNHIYFGIKKYFEIDLNDWYKIFMNKINFDSIPDEEVKSKVFLGLFQLNESHMELNRKNLSRLNL